MLYLFSNALSLIITRILTFAPSVPDRQMPAYQDSEEIRNFKTPAFDNHRFVEDESFDNIKEIVLTPLH